jgi:hypothetical protein
LGPCTDAAAAGCAEETAWAAWVLVRRVVMAAGRKGGHPDQREACIVPEFAGGCIRAGPESGVCATHPPVLASKAMTYFAG